jgi:hypothetical protein
MAMLVVHAMQSITNISESFRGILKDWYTSKNRAMTSEQGKCSVFLVPPSKQVYAGGAVSSPVGNCDNGKAQPSDIEASEQRPVVRNV